MSAPLNNKNAAGNNGGFAYTAEYRDKQRRLKEKAIDLSLEILESGTFKGQPISKAEQMNVMKDVLKNAMPKEVEIGGSETMNPITIIVKAME